MIVAVRIVQPKERVWLEITTEEEIGDQLKRADLGFICSGDRKIPFDPKDSVSVNARRFVDE